MIEQSVSLASNGVVKVPGYEQLVRFGYTKNRGVYRGSPPRMRGKVHQRSAKIQRYGITPACAGKRYHHH